MVMIAMIIIYIMKINVEVLISAIHSDVTLILVIHVYHQLWWHNLSAHMSHLRATSILVKNISRLAKSIKPLHNKIFTGKPPEPLLLTLIACFILHMVNGAYIWSNYSNVYIDRHLSYSHWGMIIPLQIKYTGSIQMHTIFPNNLFWSPRHSTCYYSAAACIHMWFNGEKNIKRGKISNEAYGCWAKLRYVCGYVKSPLIHFCDLQR